MRRRSRRVVSTVLLLVALLLPGCRLPSLATNPGLTPAFVGPSIPYPPTFFEARRSTRVQYPTKGGYTDPNLRASQYMLNAGQEIERLVKEKRLTYVEVSDRVLAILETWSEETDDPIRKEFLENLQEKVAGKDWLSKVIKGYYETTEHEEVDAILEALDASHLERTQVYIAARILPPYPKMVQGLILFGAVIEDKLEGKDPPSRNAAMPGFLVYA